MAETASPSPGLARLRLILWVLVAIAAIAATALFVLRPPPGPLAVTGEPFTLASTEGGTFTHEDLRGTPSLVFFGYTFCPDVCPTTMADMAAWREALGLGPEALRTIFVTVDPERDTLETVKSYVEALEPQAIGLVGDVEQTAAAKGAFGAASEKVGEGEDYLVNHSASVFLIGRDGAFKGTIAYGEGRETALTKIRRLVSG